MMYCNLPMYPLSIFCHDITTFCIQEIFPVILFIKINLHNIGIKSSLQVKFQARIYTMSMPYRVHRIEEFVKQLESGDLKLRVRVLEVNYFLHFHKFCEQFLYLQNSN